MAFSQFEIQDQRYRAANLVIDILELHKLIRAGDGAAFDEHWADMLENSVDPEDGLHARLLSRMEERTPRTYRPSTASRFPHAFALTRSLALLSKNELVAFMLGPSGFTLREARYPGWQNIELADSDIESFQHSHHVSFDNMWHAELVDELAAMVGLAPFGAMNHESLGVDYSMRFSPLQALFHVLTSDQRLRATLATLCGVDQQTFSRFSGRIYRMVPSRDADVWHNDVHATDRRIIALSLYLESPAPRGGKLLMRRAGLRRPFAQDPPKPRGTLTVFRISHDLEHKVGRVWRGARTNFAGWYLSAPDFDYRGKWLDRPWVGGPGNSLPWLHRQFARR